MSSLRALLIATATLLALSTGAPAASSPDNAIAASAAGSATTALRPHCPISSWWLCFPQVASDLNG